MTFVQKMEGLLQKNVTLQRDIKPKNKSRTTNSFVKVHLIISAKNRMIRVNGNRNIESAYLVVITS